MTTATATKYLNIDHGSTSRIPVKSVSTSTISLLPRPILPSTSSSRIPPSHRTTIVPKKTVTTDSKTLKFASRQQRATHTPQVRQHRRRTSSSSSSSSLTNNWLTSIFTSSSSTTTSQQKKRINSAIRLTVDKKKENFPWQVVTDHTPPSIRYLGLKNSKKFDFGKE